VAVCSVGGTDIADWLVRNGLALDSPTAKATIPMHRPKQSASSVELSGLQTRGWKAGRLFGRLKLADKHFASVIRCVDDEIIRWLERRERRKRDRLAGSRHSVYRYLP
jgi:hypothetical protein